MKVDYQIRPFEEGDEKSIVKLLQLAFDGWPKLDLHHKSIEHWIWKFSENPHGHSAISIAEWKDEIIGCHHWYPQLVKVGKKKHRCLHGADLAVHPNFRRIGIYNKTINMLQKMTRARDFLYNYWISRNPIVIKSSVNRSSTYNQIRNLVKINDVDKQLEEMPMKNTFFTKWGFLLMKKYNSMRYVFSRSPCVNNEIEINRVKYFDDRIYDFWSNVSFNYNFILVRDKEYMNWRYCDSRGGNFIINQVEEDNKIVGYSVFLINKLLDYHVGYIVDMLALPNRLDIIRALSIDAIDFFNENMVNIINYQVVKGHPYESVLKKCGFIDSGINITIFFNLLRAFDNIEGHSIGPKGKVFLTYGDHDSFPVRLSN